MSDTTAIKTATSSLSQKENDCGLEIRGGYHLDQHTALKKCNVATSEIPGQIDSVESESEDTTLTNVETGPRMTLRSMTIKNGKAFECGSATVFFIYCVCFPDSIQDKIDHIYQTARHRRRRHLQWRELNTEMMSLVMDCLDVRESVITVRRQFEAANRQIQFLRH